MIEISMSALALLSQILTGVFSYGPVSNGVDNETYEEIYCLALNSYWEARGESFDEKLATAQVVMNRVTNEHYPNMVCEVVTEGPIRESWKTRQYPDLDQEDRVYYPVKNQCQFSWYCDGRSDIIYNFSSWENSVIAALLVYAGYGEDTVDGATHYFAHKKIDKPSWAEHMTVTAIMEGHTYLK